MFSEKLKRVLFLACSLCDALEDNNIEQITILLENHRADPNVLLPSHGVTPFHLVIGHESHIFAEKVTKLFLLHDGNPDIKSVEGMTPVHVAAAWGRVKILELLLANGGNPLCLDNDKRSPFHYAFDGQYYDAITVLGKYSGKSEDLDEEDDDEESDDEDCHCHLFYYVMNVGEATCCSDKKDKPKFQIKLEKILVNRGDVVAEYVPPEIDITNYMQYDIKDSSNLSYYRRACSKIYSLTSWERMMISVLSPKYSDSHFEDEDDVPEELLRQYIKKITNSPSISAKVLKRLNELHKYKRTEELNKYVRRLSQKECFRNIQNLREKGIHSALLDTSIVSKSPNIHIPMKRRNDEVMPSPPRKESSPTWTKKYFTPKKNVCSPESTQSSLNGSASQDENISSTPKRESIRRRYRLGKLFEGDRSPTKIPLDKTYVEHNYDIVSSYIEESKPPIPQQRELSSAEKVDDTKFHGLTKADPNPKNGNRAEFKHLLGKPDKDEKVLTFFPIPDNDRKKPILGIAGTSSRFQQGYHFWKNPLANPKPQIIETTIEEKYESLEFFESPGSSRATSASYQCQSIKNEFDSNDELEIWNEINAIYQDRGCTPPASISTLTDGSSTTLNTSENSTHNVEELTPNCENTSVNSVVHIDEPRNSVKDEDMERFDESRTSEDYGTTQELSISSRSCTETFVSIDEEYAYIDAKKDVAFTERRLLVVPKVEDLNRAKLESTLLHTYDELPTTSNQTSPRTSGEFDKKFNRGEFLITNENLRHELMAHGDTPGPITDTTHYVYLKRLYKLKKKNIKNLNECITTQSQNEIPESPKISKALLATDWVTNLKFYRDLEEFAFDEYESLWRNRKYRGGYTSTSFNYLLLDPRITNDLPRKGRDLCLAERWKIFLKAIFYVGKGKNSRPFQHLYESHEFWTKKRHDDEPSEKIQRILNIWRDGKGVICHQVFQNSMQEEAFSREAAMIDALGTKHLSNCQRGTYYGLAATMSRGEQKALGKYLLYKSMEILMHSGERQQFPRNIE